MRLSRRRKARIKRQKAEAKAQERKSAKEFNLSMDRIQRRAKKSQLYGSAS
jgi:hypothetical protein